MRINYNNNKIALNKNYSINKNNIYSIKNKNYTFERGERATRFNFSLPVNNYNWRHKYDFVQITLLIFCPCLHKSKKLKKEYDYLYNKLESYCDFVKVTRLLMEYKEETVNMKKNISEINKNIRLNRRVLSKF